MLGRLLCGELGVIPFALALLVAGGTPQDPQGALESALGHCSADEADSGGQSWAPFVPAHALTVMDDLSLVVQLEGGLLFPRLAGVAPIPSRRAEARDRLQGLARGVTHLSVRSRLGERPVVVLMSGDGDPVWTLLMEGLVRYTLPATALTPQERCVYREAAAAARPTSPDSELDPYADALRVALGREAERASQRGEPVHRFVVDKGGVAAALPAVVGTIPVLYPDHASLVELAQQGPLKLHVLRPIAVRGSELVVHISCYGFWLDGQTETYSLSGGWDATYRLDPSVERFVLSGLKQWGI